MLAPRSILPPLKIAVRSVLACIILSLTAATRPTPAPAVVLWAWERPEDLRFAGPGTIIAVLAGTVRLSGNDVSAQPRLQPALVLPSQQIIGVVHLEIDRARRPAWNAAQRARTAAAVRLLLKNPRYTNVQIDFEVHASERHILLDLLADVRAQLDPGRALSMTALASWCDTETWIAAAPVDEIVPMLFRMGPAGEPIRRRLANGGEFHEPHCRASVGIATDAPPDRLPPGRRLWLFNPHSWTPQDLFGLRARSPEAGPASGVNRPLELSRMRSSDADPASGVNRPLEPSQMRSPEAGPASGVNRPLEQTRSTLGRRNLHPPGPSNGTPA